MGEDVCPVCLDEPSRMRPLVRMPCNHSLHVACAIRYELHCDGDGFPCPMCRRETCISEAIAYTWARIVKARNTDAFLPTLCDLAAILHAFKDEYDAAVPFAELVWRRENTEAIAETLRIIEDIMANVSASCAEATVS